MRMILVAGGFDFLKRRIKIFFYLIKKGCAKSIAEISIVKVFNVSSKTVITIAAFRNKAVNVRIPF